jgi:quercetin dioxygenase-like cupin family protein
MYVARRRVEGAESALTTTTFTGTVWRDSVMPTTDGTTINDVFFGPGSRTFWHHHENGQLLIVLSGSGFVRPDGGEPARIEAGDVVWVPPGERHWHGAAADSFMIHRAVSLGKTAWAEAVADADYAAVVG